MGNKVPKHFKIVAEPDAKKPDGVDFHIADAKGFRVETLIFNKKLEGMHHDDDHEVHFELIQESGMTLEFAQSLDDVLWVAWGDKTHIPACPKKKPPPVTPAIFYATGSHVNKMTAVNTNPQECYFSFCINFVDPHSQTPTKLIPFDPIGENQNSGITRSWLSDMSATTMAVGIAAVAIVAVLGFMLLR